MKTDYQFIIAGAGCSGLSLAWYLQEAGLLNNNRLLIFDKSFQRKNDKTWSFWIKGEPYFKDIIHQTYHTAIFRSSEFEKEIPLHQYRYHVIRSLDFYQHLESHLRSNTNITWMETGFEAAIPDSQLVKVETDQGIFTGNYFFSSIYEPPSLAQLKKFTYLKQHFMGWVVESPDWQLDPAKFVIHDFDFPQPEFPHFFYVLPYGTNRALVEYTVFSKDLLPKEEYKRQLEWYIAEKLKLKSYQLIDQEFGVIPMTDFPFQARKSKRIIPIGVTGGAAKPSTGYAFLRIQQQTSWIANLLKQGKAPVTPPGSNYFFRLLDAVMLKVLSSHGHLGAEIFRDLFNQNNEGVFDFLSEVSTPRDILKIMRSMPYQGLFRQEFLKLLISGRKI
jgi:lycopene beta-cyclase